MKNITQNQKILIGIGILVVLFGLWFAGSYNSLVGSDEEVQEKWANVQSAYQRRADLIPNLVTTVQKYSDYEGGLLKEVTQLRSKVGSASTPSQLSAAGSDLNSALSRLLVVVENYPTLKANENYLSLQDELAGSENRVKVERDIYNKAVKTLNVKVRRFPTNIVASISGFEKKESFSADEGADIVPKVGELFN